MTCDRCKTSTPNDTAEWLVFKSRHKETKLNLCPVCFHDCRETFIKWMEYKPDDRKDNPLSSDNI